MVEHGKSGNVPVWNEFQNRNAMRDGSRNAEKSAGAD
jgi:hypothetical protein